MRIHGDRADNLEKVIAHLEGALSVLTREALPRDWANVQHSLALGYGQRKRGDRADNLEKAIAACEEALTVRTRETEPYDWAITQHTLANVYAKRVRGDRADNLEKAIAAYEAALTVRTREAEPHDWAMTLQALASAYEENYHGNRADNLKKSIAAYEAALTVRTRDALPREHLITARLLGNALLQAREWREAGLAYRSSREAFLLLFGEGLNETEARDLIAVAGPLFAEAAFAAAEQADTETALALASEGRARLMALALRLQALSLPEDKRHRLDGLRTAIRSEQRAAEATQGTERAAAIEKLVRLRQELLGLIREADAAENRPGTALVRARAVAAQGATVVVPIVTKVGGKS